MRADNCCLEKPTARFWLQSAKKGHVIFPTTLVGLQTNEPELGPLGQDRNPPSAPCTPESGPGAWWGEHIVEVCPCQSEYRRLLSPPNLPSLLYRPAMAMAEVAAPQSWTPARLLLSACSPYRTFTSNPVRKPTPEARKKNTITNPIPPPTNCTHPIHPL